MINSKEVLQDYLSFEKKLYIPDGFIQLCKLKFLHSQNYSIWHYQKMLRLSEYHYNTNHKLRYLFYQRKKNIEGLRLGIYINHNTIDKGLRIFHYGSIIIHDNAHIGRNCHLHGENCIGNKGIETGAPFIGDNCSIGVGAKILGNITLENNVIVGAGSIVVKSFSQNNITLVGIPAQIINSKPHSK